MNIADELRKEKETKYEVFKQKYGKDFLDMVVDSIKKFGYFEHGAYDDLDWHYVGKPRPDSPYFAKNWLLSNIKYDKGICPYGFEYCVQYCTENGFAATRSWQGYSGAARPCDGFDVRL